MALDKTIFSLRFGSNEVLYPTPADLGAFLESPKQKGARGRLDNGLSTYRELLERITAFEQNQHEGASTRNFHERLFCRVISLSQFINPVLKREVDLYRYHLNSLATLDFNKPTVFIRAAEKEISNLNLKRKKEAAKAFRLQLMVEERKRAIETLEKRRAALAKELGSIARYVRANLEKIGRLCEASIVILMELQMSGKMEHQLIDDINADFEERFRDVLHRGPVAGQDLQMLNREMSLLVRDDLYALAGLYEDIYDHMKRIVRELDSRMAEIEIRKNRTIEEDCELFTQIEQVLVELISAFHFELKSRDVRSLSGYENILMEKRYEMIEKVFALLGSERRVWTDRRSDEHRRRFHEREWQAPERRQRAERRGKDRREPAASGFFTVPIPPFNHVGNVMI